MVSSRLQRVWALVSTQVLSWPPRCRPETLCSCVSSRSWGSAGVGPQHHCCAQGRWGGSLVVMWGGARSWGNSAGH